MATKNTPQAQAVEPKPSPENTPENTPVPGAGRYKWSDTAPHWVEIDEADQPIPAADPAATPTEGV
ncbi:hypothetical protein LHU53_15575 [Rhodoferax sp. U2-2l]|uniref:hypothetical protein n=1 Tax=Rhodoferax sp. U2-2l TaxID=2884000 RepID=UPI001D0B5D28|nr:hypothetical protein [Rhodoferax sp. U2-2l]MCB8748320.1 hypothetical protein [Rhodoferax sp. U2-2l]